MRLLTNSLPKVVALFAATLAACATQPIDRSPANEFEVSLLAEDGQHAIALADAGRDDEAHALLRDIIAAPAFKALPGTSQRAILATAAIIHGRAGRLDAGYALLGRAAEADPDEPYTRYMLSTFAYDLGRKGESAQSAIVFLERWPDLGREISARHAVGLALEREMSRNLRFAFMQALLASAWDSRQPGAAVVWYELALEHLLRDDVQSAASVTRKINHPHMLARMVVDKRFDALQLSSTPDVAVRDAALAYVADLEALAESSNPPEGIVSELSYAMLMAGLNEKLLESTAVRLAAPGKGRSVGNAGDARETTQKAWLLNNRAIANRRLARSDEALRDLLHATSLSEGGSDKVSQVLNLAWFYCNLGRPDDALATLNRAGQMSGYGRLVEAAVRNWAAVLQDDASGADQALTFLRTHYRDGEQQFLDALLRSGKLDDAAELVIDLLDSETTRGDALFWSQSFLVPEMLPGDVAFRRNRTLLLERQDVRQAIHRVGRIGHFPIYGDTGTD